jgi:hypothetical protein
VTTVYVAFRDNDQVAGVYSSYELAFQANSIVSRCCIVYIEPHELDLMPERPEREEDDLDWLPEKGWPGPAVSWLQT